MSGIDEYVLFLETWDPGISQWMPQWKRMREDDSHEGMTFRIVRVETPKLTVVHYEIDGHDVPREDFLAVIASLNSVKR